MRILLVITALMVTILSCKKPLPAVKYPYFIIEDNYDTTISLANKQDKNIFLLLHADWCSVCQDFKTNVLANNDTKSLLENKIIVSIIDGDKTYGKTYYTKYNADGFPTYLILDKNGIELQRKRGALKKDEFTTWVTPYLK